MKTILKILGFLAAALALLFAVALLAFYHLIQVGELRRFLIGEFEQRTGMKVEVGEAEVEMGRVMGVSFRDFVLREPEQSRALIAAPRLVVRVALLPLLKRKLVFYGLRLHEPKVEIVRDEHGKVAGLDHILNLAWQSNRDARFSLDLREVGVEKGDFTLAENFLGAAPVTTRFREVDLDLRHVRTRGLLSFLRTRNSPADKQWRFGVKVDLKAVVERNGRQGDVALTGRALFPEAALDVRQVWLDADLKSETMPAALVWQYFERPLTENPPRGNLAARVHWEGTLAEGTQLKGEFHFKGLEAEAPNLFPSTVALGDGRVEVILDWKPQVIHFQRFDLRSTNLALALQGSLRSLESREPRVDLRLSTPFLPLTSVRNYIPTKLLHSPRLESLAAGVDQGEISFGKMAISGTLSQLRRLFEPGQEENLSLAAEVRDAGGNFGADHSLAVRGVSGQVVLAQGTLQYKNFQGIIGQSRLTEVNGTQRGGVLELRIKGETELAQLAEPVQLGVLPPAAAKLFNAVPDLGGHATVDLFVRTDFVSAYHYEGTVSLDAVHLKVGDVSFTQLKGNLLLAPTEIRSDRATALAADSPVQLRLLLKNFATDQGTFDLTIDSAGVKASAALRLLIPQDTGESPGFVRGTVRYQGSLAAAGNRKLTGSLELIGVQVTLKVFSQPFQEVSGKVRLDGKTIDLEDIRAQAGGYSFSLKGRWMDEGRPMFLFSLSAPEMDVAYLLPRHVIPDEEWYDRLQVRGKLILDRGRYQTFPFSDFKTDVVLERRIWRMENFFARSQGGTVEGVGAFDDHPEQQRFMVEPNIKGVPVQELLSWFDLGTTEITGKVQLAGKLDFTGKTPIEKKRSLNGAFRLRLEDGVVRRLQLLVRILSFLDLSRWFTLNLPNANQEGIHFRSVTADVKVAQGVYSTQNLFVDGDDLRITGEGTLDGPKGEIDFTIAVRPFPGIDTAANYIPIFGTGLAAIKNIFLVASLHIKGPIHDPSITPAPLSTLSEYFYGVLNVPKGLIGLPVTGEPK
ncbi:MAG TPA: AsmA-like C-terminal region-containing protein [Candidatus Binatia bacterium]|jgi:uncharacterized protein YhdP